MSRTNPMMTTKILRTVMPIFLPRLDFFVVGLRRCVMFRWRCRRVVRRGSMRGLSFDIAAMTELVVVAMFVAALVTIDHATRT
jgi:hypothetical protein